MGKDNITFANGKQGMVRDVHPMNLSDTQYTFAKNANIEDSSGDAGIMLLQNEPSNFLCTRFKEGYKIIGFKTDVVTGRTYYFSVKPAYVEGDVYNKPVSEIGYVDETYDVPDLGDRRVDCEGCYEEGLLSKPLEGRSQVESCVYMPIMSDECDDLFSLNFDVDYPIHDIVIKHEKCGVVLYWTDNHNPPRYLKVDRLEEYKYSVDAVCDTPAEIKCKECSQDDYVKCPNVDKMRIFPIFDSPCLKVKTLSYGGSLPRGTYEFLMAYCDQRGEILTPVLSITNPTPIFDHNNVIIDQSQIADPTSISIELELKDLDKSYRYYKIFVIQVSDVNRATNYYVEGVHPITDTTITYAKTGTPTTLTEIFTQKTVYEKTEGMVESDGRLWQYGLTSHRTWNLQPVVNLMGAFLEWTTYVADEDLYKDGANCSLYRGYMRDEVVPFSIRFVTNTGYKSPLYPLVGRPAIEGEKDVFTENDFKYNNDLKSISLFTPDCVDNPRNQRWQFYNTATQSAKFCSADDLMKHTFLDFENQFTRDYNNVGKFVDNKQNFVIKLSLDSGEEFTSLEDYVRRRFERDELEKVSDLELSNLASDPTELGKLEYEYALNWNRLVDFVTTGTLPNRKDRWRFLGVTNPDVSDETSQLGGYHLLDSYKPKQVKGYNITDFDVVEDFTSQEKVLLAVKIDEIRKVEIAKGTPASEIDVIIQNRLPELRVSVKKEVREKWYSVTDIESLKKDGEDIEGCSKPVLDTEGLDKPDFFYIPQGGVVIENLNDECKPCESSVDDKNCNKRLCLDVNGEIKKKIFFNAKDELDYDRSVPPNACYIFVDAVDGGDSKRKRRDVDFERKYAGWTGYGKHVCKSAYELRCAHKNRFSRFWCNLQIEQDIALGRIPRYKCWWDRVLARAKRKIYLRVKDVFSNVVLNTYKEIHRNALELDVVEGKMEYPQLFYFDNYGFDGKVSSVAVVKRKNSSLFSGLGDTNIALEYLDYEGVRQEVFSKDFQKGAFTFKGKFEDKSDIYLEISHLVNSEGFDLDDEASVGTNVRVTIFKDSRLTTVVYQDIINLADKSDEGFKRRFIKLKHSNFKVGEYFYITIEQPVVQYAVTRYVYKDFSGIDLNKDGIIDEHEQRNADNYKDEHGGYINHEAGSSTVTISRTAPLKGCFGVVLRKQEYKEVLLHVESVSLSRRSHWIQDCVQKVPVYEGCRPVPFAKGGFGYHESIVDYPDNKEMFDSSRLKVAVDSVPSSYRKDFERYFVAHTKDVIQTNDGEVVVTKPIVKDGYYTLSDSCNLTCKPIRHYRFPDNNVAPFMSTDNRVNFKKSFIYPLGVSVNPFLVYNFLNVARDNGLISKQERDSIIGYEVFRGDRVADRSVIAKGLLYDVYKYKEFGKDVYYPNYPYNTLGKDALNRTFNSNVNNPEYIAHPYNSVGNNLFTFHSPDTHFNKPVIPSEMKIEGFQMGKSRGVFAPVETHSEWVVLGSVAYSKASKMASMEVLYEKLIKGGELAIQTSQNQWFVGGVSTGGGMVGAITGALSLALALKGMVDNVNAKKSKLEYEWQRIYREQGQPNNFAYYYTSVGFYNNFMKNPFVYGNNLRALATSKYLKSGRYNIVEQTTGFSINVNNFQRESSVFLSLGLGRPYKQKRGGKNPLLEYPKEYISIDNYDENPHSSSRTFGSESGVRSKGVSKELLKSIASPYVSVKQYNPSQYGSVYNIRWIPTGECVKFTDFLGKDSEFCYGIFGGDTFISRFSLKRKFPMFLTNAIGLAPNMPFQYSKYFNVGKARFFVDFLVQDITVSYRSDFPKLSTMNRMDGISESFYVTPPSKFYLYYYGIPQFLVESEINCNFRYARKEYHEDFYPNVGDYVDWTQEKNVSIKKDNEFYYNEGYSKPATQVPHTILPVDYNREFFDCANNAPNGVIYSEVDSSEQEMRDPYLQYKPNNFYQFPSNYGKLLSITASHDGLLLSRFENTSAAFRGVDLLQSLSSVSNYELGTGGVFAQTPKQLIKTDLGFAGTQNKAIVSCEHGDFWVDAKRGQVIHRSSQGVVEIVDGLRNWFREHLPYKFLKGVGVADNVVTLDNPYNKFGVTMGWDNRYKRVFLTKRDAVLHSFLYKEVVKPVIKKTVTYELVEHTEKRIVNRDVYNPVVRADVPIKKRKLVVSEEWLKTHFYLPKLGSYISLLEVKQSLLRYHGEGYSLIGLSDFDAVISKLNRDTRILTDTDVAALKRDVLLSNGDINETVFDSLYRLRFYKSDKSSNSNVSKTLVLPNVTVLFPSGFSESDIRLVLADAYDVMQEVVKSFSSVSVDAVLGGVIAGVELCPERSVEDVKYFYNNVLSFVRRDRYRDGVMEEGNLKQSCESTKVYMYRSHDDLFRPNAYPDGKTLFESAHNEIVVNFDTGSPYVFSGKDGVSDFTARGTEDSEGVFSEQQPSKLYKVLFTLFNITFSSDNKFKIVNIPVYDERDEKSGNIIQHGVAVYEHDLLSDDKVLEYLSKYPDELEEKLKPYLDVLKTKNVYVDKADDVVVEMVDDKSVSTIPLKSPKIGTGGDWKVRYEFGARLDEQGSLKGIDKDGFWSNILTKSITDVVEQHIEAETRNSTVFYEYDDVEPVMVEVEEESSESAPFIEYVKETVEVEEVSVKTVPSRVVKEEVEYITNRVKEWDKTDASFTMAYSPITKSWISYYDFKPNWYVSRNNYFQTGVNENISGVSGNHKGLWTHLLTNKSYQVFYGVKYPFTIELPIKEGYTNKLLRNVEYWLDCRRYHNDFDFAENRQVGFNKAWLYNNSSNTGLLHLIRAEKNNRFQHLQYPKIVSDGVQILATQNDKKWTFNDFYNRVRNELSNTPLWLNDVNQIDRYVNVKAMSYNQKWLDRMRGDWFLVRLSQDIESRYKIIFKWLSSKENLY